MSKIKAVLMTLFITACCLWGENVSVNYQMGNNGPSISSVIKTEHAKLLISAKTNEDGTLDVKTPPFFCIDFGPYIKLGEIKPSGIVKQALNPADISINYMGFLSNRFEDVNTPSLIPDYSGIVIPFGKVDVFSFSNALNPASPLGFGFDCGNEKLFACLMIYDKTALNIKMLDNYQIDWKEEIGNFKTLNILFGGVSNIALKKLFIRAQSFIDITDDITCGRAVYIGTDFKLQIKSFHLLAKKRLSKNSDNLLLQIKLGDLLNISYSNKTGSKPVYGGFYQQKESSFKTSVKIGKFSYSNQISKSISKKGSINTEDNLSVKFGNSESNATITAKLNLKSDGLEFSSWKIEAKCKLMNLSFSQGKTQISYTFSKKISEKSKAELTINQDRKISVVYTLKE